MLLNARAYSFILYSFVTFFNGSIDLCKHGGSGLVLTQLKILVIRMMVINKDHFPTSFCKRINARCSINARMFYIMTKYFKNFFHIELHKVNGIQNSFQHHQRYYCLLL